MEQLGFLTPNEIRQDLQPYINSEGTTNGATEPFYDTYMTLTQSRAFKNFVLTTPDGTRYTFGGAGAVEYSKPFYATRNFERVDLNSWYLKKIEDIYGNVIDFVYNKDYITCDLQDGVLVNGFEVTKTTQTGSPALTRTSSTNFNTQYGSFIFPIYLSSISSENEIVTFNSAIANTLKYTTQQLKNGEQSNINLTVIGNDLNNLQTKKLVNLSVLDKINNKTVKTAAFYYNEGENIRFSLKSLTINNSEKYSFNYAGEGIAQSPFLLKTEDFWNDAYANAYLNPQLANGSTHFTAAFPQFLILKKITYPTKGYTEFMWEGHKYGRKVSPARNSLIYETGYVEGSRIAEIRNFSDNNELLTKKTYLYVKNYNNLTTNTDYLLSSGTSEGSPKIRNSYYATIGTSNYLVKSIHTPYQTMFNLAANGLRVGYDEVVEKNADNSYTKHHFTSYDYDITGHNHFDQPPVNRKVLTLPDNFTQYYYPYSNLELERGKPVGVFDYNSANKLVKQIITNYRDDFTRFSSFYKQIKMARSGAYNDNSDFASSIPCFVALKLFNYNYYPLRQETITYDINGNNPIITSEEFGYNANNQLAVKSANIPNSVEKNYFKYFYPTDLPNEPLMANLIQANRINSSVLEEVHEGVAKIKAQKTTFVSTTVSSGTIPMPSKLYSAKFPNNYPVIPNVGQMESKITYNKYDDKGNLLQYTSENGLSTVFLWGYKKMYPIAKIENATYASVQQYEANLQTISNSADSENSLLSALQILRTSLPDSMVTTYTYSPLIGVSTVTSPNGETIKYKYDVLNKLQSISDKDNQILQYYEYHNKQ